MLTPEQQDTLTRVGPGTPMGSLLRRYWLPVAARCELDERPTRAVRLLGEDLVLFRDARGALGLVQQRCPHRGASLAYGSVEADGIRCPYHGWKFAHDGRCLETPAEPVGSRLPERVHARAYAARELGGLIFAYLGPEPAPLLPRFDLLVWDNCLRDIGQALLPCNFLQIMENSVDPHHLEWLHGHQLRVERIARGLEPPRHYDRRHQKVRFDRFEYGILKRRVLEGGTEQDDDWKVGHPLVFPIMLRVGAGGHHRFEFRVPVDDTHTWHVWYTCYRPADGARAPSQPRIPLYDVPWRDATGEHIVDTLVGQDIMTWVTAGAIADRCQEQLASSDEGIALLRRLYLEQIEQVGRGADPLGVVRNAAANERIELPQEANKYRSGNAFLAESLSLGYARYSPIRKQALDLLGVPDGGS
jgi:5,5'-dehydrodivanillate O-demethylase